MGTVVPSKKTLAQLLQGEPPSPPDSPVDPKNQPPGLVLPIEQPSPLPNVPAAAEQPRFPHTLLQK
ncbi:hypothetical protein RHMOL_Rhmol09G0237600 [Rhododendron molle]|uniref:Uncharacterized protein n=1 Tax=Rhododendron molle TaxID=49168 RepID=A0ACC0MHQ6_RHOML|nr:hypothetical protein RHMOL_Rhmol09G0237600 [Rhododendron molle]